MIREPKIPMSPEDLPQQRISYLAGLAGAFHGRRVDRLGATDFSVPELVERELAVC